MIGLFGYETTIQAKEIITPIDRARKLAEKQNRILDKAIQRSNEFKDKYDLKKLNLSSFNNEERSTSSEFIGQNVYIKPSYVVSMPEYCFFDRNTGEILKNPRTLTAAFIDNQENLRNNDKKGKLSKKAVTGLRNSINWLCISAKKKWVFDKKKDRSFNFKVNFVTLTLPDTDQPISSADFQKKLLNPFLTYMRKYGGLKNYVWRLEFQANGKLHVHLTTDTFLHLRLIKDTWNRLLDSGGYLESFFKANGHRDPNSTDVHATKKIKNLAGYLSKYMSKKNSLYKYPLKDISEKINIAVASGLGGKQIESLVKKMESLKREKRSHPLLKFVASGPSKHKGWYLQRLNFWNSPFNPRPITGRIWSCNKELSEANKCVVHIPASDCSKDLSCLMRGDIEYRELTTVKKSKKNVFDEADPIETPKKYGEVFFLTAMDWYSKITGPVRRAFEDTKKSIQDLVFQQNFELS